MRSIIPLSVGVLMLVLLLSLGFWQLDRAQQKRDFEVAFAAAQQASPRPVDTIRRLQELPRLEPVRLIGSYEASQQGLLDVQMHQGRAGYRVWTPFRLANGDRVLVDRGWVMAGDRAAIPEISVEETRRVVIGMVSPLPEPGLRLGVAELGETTWPRRLHWPDAEALRRNWGSDIAPVLVLLAPDQEDGFVREWNPVGPIPPERHIGYAVQWFALAAALVVIAVVMVWRGKERKSG